MTINTLNFRKISFGISIGIVLLLLTTWDKQMGVCVDSENPLLSKEFIVVMYKYYLGIDFFLIVGLITLNILSFFEKYRVGSVLGILFILFGIIKLI